MCGSSATTSRRVILVTGHYLQSDRRAGFHGLAEAFWRAGDEVIFVTTAISWLSVLVGNYRMRHPVMRQAGRLQWVKERLGSYVWWTPWHAADLRLRVLNRISARWFSRYGELPLGELEGLVRGADMIVFDSTPGVMLLERFRRIRPEARYVYRASDDMRMLQVHPVVRQTEERVVSQFDLLSSPSAAIHRRFTHLPQARLDPHGIDKAAFDKTHPSPYQDSDGRTKAVFVGVSRLDVDFLCTAAGMFPDWDFHVIGPMGQILRRNIISHGLLPFERTVPYLQHADVGLHCLKDAPGVEAFTDSLKVIQYTYCRLPIVAPEFLRSSRGHVLCYEPGNRESIRKALLDAKAFDRAKVDTSEVRSWDQVADLLWQNR